MATNKGGNFALQAQNDYRLFVSASPKWHKFSAGLNSNLFQFYTKNSICLCQKLAGAALLFSHDTTLRIRSFLFFKKDGMIGYKAE